MMKLNDLKPLHPKEKPWRVGRGIGSGNGKTSGRGHKGQLSRSGGGVRVSFEGGQMPLVRRIPKRGFVNIFKKEYSLVNLKDLEDFEAGTVITPELLRESGKIKKIKDGVKILGEGKITKPLIVRVNAVSQSARAKIEAAGGKVEVE